MSRTHSRIRWWLVGAMAAVLAGCGVAEEPEPAASDRSGQSSPSVRDAAGYTDQTRENFVASCTQEAVAVTAGELAESRARELCGCFYRGVEQEVPFEDFAAADRSGQVPAEWQSITENCQQDAAAY